MSTVGAVVNEIRRELLGYAHAELNWLDGTITDSATSLTAELDVRFATGTILSIDDELLYVVAVSGKTITVKRGFMGTAAAAHSSGAEIEVNPRFARPMIRDSLRREIRSWEPRLFAVAEADISVDSDVRGYAFSPTDWLFPLDFKRQRTGETSEGDWPRASARLVRFPTNGSRLELTSQPFTGTVRIVYARRFDFTAFADDTDLATVGLAASMEDVAVYGTCWRLMSTREILRTDTGSQGEPRAAEEVPPGHPARTADELKDLRDGRLAEEAQLLRTLYPLAHLGG